MPPAVPLRAVLFDFDYTLIDATEGNLECLSFGLIAVGLPPASRRDALEATGLSLPELLRKFHGPGATAATLERFVEAFARRADEVMLDHIVVYPVVPSVLRQVHDLGFVLGIVSTKYRRRLEAVLQRQQLSSLFSVLVGGDDVEQHKPHPEGLERAARALGLPVQACLYVGDHVVDAEAASRCGMPFVAVSTGFTEPSVWERFPHLGVLEDTSRLPALLQQVATSSPLRRLL